MARERHREQDTLDWISNLLDNDNVEVFWDRLDKLETGIRRGVIVTPAMIAEISNIEDKGIQHEESKNARLECGNNRGQFDERS